jgi:hypothetical protein
MYSSQKQIGVYPANGGNIVNGGQNEESDFLFWDVGASNSWADLCK